MKSFAQHVGLTLEEIGVELSKLPPQRVPNRSDWARLSREWKTQIDERIAELERLKLGLTECIGCGCLSLDRCRLSNPSDRAARLGPGPRYWIGDHPVRERASEYPDAQAARRKRHAVTAQRA